MTARKVWKSKSSLFFCWWRWVWDQRFFHGVFLELYSVIGVVCSFLLVFWLLRMGDSYRYFACFCVLLVYIHYCLQFPYLFNTLWNMKRKENPRPRELTVVLFLRSWGSSQYTFLSPFFTVFLNLFCLCFPGFSAVLNARNREKCVYSIMFRTWNQHALLISKLH